MRILGNNRAGSSLLITPLISPMITPLITALVAAASLLDGQAAWAQREVKKIGTICPMGYVDTFNGNCSTLGLMRYTVQPTNGRPCPEGWMNVGGGYCRRK